MKCTIQIYHFEHVMDPYIKWELVKQAEECRLLLKELVHFTKVGYLCYISKRGVGIKASGFFLLGVSNVEVCPRVKFITATSFLLLLFSFGRYHC